ncbi:hypothetical protein EW026_g4095 [Hermanssonia centrifuga]|uniref:Piwi domain-containing protein n=1 Tax=Hermanssonia centrifuga TaxID=98765 RepID=A0A4S4KJF2_9APHY|nr:hypothetical protein EW026_g4095 [Hermanssonia centrifuga]
MGGMVSVERYFQQKYKIKLRYADTLPVIDVGANAPVYLPAEVCEIIPYQPFRGKLPAQASASMVKISTRSSASNANSIINDGLRLFGLQDHNPTLMNFGISVRKEMAIVPARVLPPPRILYQSGHLVVRQGGWNLIDVKFCAPGRIDNWVVLLVRDGRKEEFNGVDDPRLQDFLQMFLLQCQSSGISIGRGLPAIITTPPLPRANANRQDAVAVIAKALKDGLNNKQKPSVMLVLLPDKSLYTGLKRLCDVRLGIHTVCMFVKTARELKGRQRYFANVALKLNSKLGGINHSLDPQSMRWLTEKKTMTVGIDVTHPSSMSMKGMPSIAAVVANADDKFAQFPASLRLQTNRNVMKDGEEMVQDLTSMLVERLTLYKKNVGALPKRVIVYRDGVSESQYNLVNQKELPQILKAFETFNAGQKYRPSLSIVVCGKRHHARFPGTSAVHMTKNGNTLPGTVVDQGVTDIFNFDFYLQLSADAIQTGIHHASYMYARATKAVSLVPPAYYADLACERARRYLAPLFDPDNAGSTLSTKGANGQEDSETGRRKVYDRAVQMWGNGVHQDLKDSMFYI